MLFDVRSETLPREELRTLQLLRLQETCLRAYSNVPFYRSRFDEIGLSPHHIKKLDDIHLLPFTDKQDLLGCYPFGFFAVPLDNMVRLQASGASGKTAVLGYTARDLANWSELVARSLAAAGVTVRDVVHVAFDYDLFNAGLGLHAGTERLGALVVPALGAVQSRQASLLRDFGVTVLCCAPSHAMRLWENGQEEGIDFRDLPLRLGCFCAEPWTDGVRREIEQKMGMNALNLYGLAEMMGPGVAAECAEAKCGLHLWEDHYLPEIINPVTGETLPDGEQGELVLTTLVREGVPLLRYRTHDLTSIDNVPCSCGRTHRRIAPIAGRTDDMLIVHGVNVFPLQIKKLLMEKEGISPNFQLVVEREKNIDTLEVRVEVTEHLFGDEIRKLQMLEKRLQKNIKEYLGINARVRLMEPQAHSCSDRIEKLVVDKRSSN